jgi:hypothetical protein
MTPRSPSVSAQIGPGGTPRRTAVGAERSGLPWTRPRTVDLHPPSAGGPLSLSRFARVDRFEHFGYIPSAMNVANRRSRVRAFLLFASLGIAGSLLLVRTFYDLHPATGTVQINENEANSVSAPYQNRRDWPHGDPVLPPVQKANQTGPTTNSESESMQSHFGNTDPKADVAEVMAQLERSGPGTGDLNARALSVFDTLKHESGNGDEVQFSDFRCYAGGCSAVAKYSDAKAYFQMTRNFVNSKAFQMWPSPKYRSGLIQDESGGVQATWVFFR